MPPAYEILLLNTAVPQIQAAQSGDTYVVPRDIAFSTVANLANGTYLLPALAFSSDPDTGIFRQGANALGFTAGGGSDQMVLTTTGLGIGTSSPAYKLTVEGTLAAKRSGANQYIGMATGSGEGYLDTINTISADYMGYYFRQTNNSGTVTRLILDSSGNLGLGVTPSAWASTHKAYQLQGGGSLYNNGADGYLNLANNFYYDGADWRRVTAAPASVYLQSSSGHLWGYVGTGTANSVCGFPSSQMALDSSGNLGLGVTPSAWTTGWTALQIAATSSFTDFNGQSSYWNNCVVTGGGTTPSYQTTAAASFYRQTAGQHIWYNAPSGTAGNAISFTQAMTLDASGNLLVGTTSASIGASGRGVIEVNGTSDAVFATKVNGTLAAVSGFASSTEVIYGAVTNVPVVFRTNNTERARITSGGDFQTSSGGSVQVGGTAARATTAGTNRLDIFDGTAPVGTLANGVSFYSTAGEARVMDAAGNATLLSPHDTETNEWIFHSKHTPTGKVLRIDVERLLKFVNDHFGLDAVQEFIEE